MEGLARNDTPRRHDMEGPSEGDVPRQRDVGRSRPAPSHPDRHHPFRLDAETYRQQNRPMLVTACTKGRRPILCGEVPAIVKRVLLERAERFHVRLHAYCIMPDHLHFFVSVSKDEGDFPGFMRSFKSISARLVNEALGLEGASKFGWQRSYWDTFAREDEDVRAEIRYMLANPVRAGFCERAEQWPHSELLCWPGT